MRAWKMAVLIICCELLAMFLFSSIGTGSAGKPNIIIFFVDDLGYGDLGCYGHPTSSTPYIDQLAAEGLLFTDFYTTCPVCSPSRAALLTGRYQTRSGVYPGVFNPPDIGGLPWNETTIAEYLKEAGYVTGMAGKWHLGVGLNGEYLPNHQGFDYYTGIPYSTDMCPCTTCFYPLKPCNPEFCDASYTGCPLYGNLKIDQQPADFPWLSLGYADFGSGFIVQQTVEERNFFLYMAFNHVHRPPFAGFRFADKSIRGPFGDALSEMDWVVGQIMSAVKSNGARNNTFVFLTSDNGPSLRCRTEGGNAGLLKCGKGTTYEGGQRVPGIAWWPGMIKPGKTTELASTLDLLPTILKLAGVEAKKGVALDGYDMGPILFEGKESLRDAFYYYPPNPLEEDGVFAVRHKQYKAHFLTQGTGLCPDVYPDHDCRPSHAKTVEDPPLLFDLHLDPSEVYTLTPSDPEYNQTMSIISKLKASFDGSMVWGESQMKRGENKADEPCAKPGCSPFPSCCKT